MIGPGDRRGLTYLHLDVQDASGVLLGNILDRLDTGTIVIGPELSVLNKATSLDKLQKVVLFYEMVLAAILLAASRCTSSVRDGESEAVGKLC